MVENLGFDMAFNIATRSLGKERAMKASCSLDYGMTLGYSRKLNMVYAFMISILGFPFGSYCFLLVTHVYKYVMFIMMWTSSNTWAPWFSSS